jgi:hypothetical protein
MIFRRRRLGFRLRRRSAPLKFTAFRFVVAGFGLLYVFATTDTQKLLRTALDGTMSASAEARDQYLKTVETKAAGNAK